MIHPRNSDTGEVKMRTGFLSFFIALTICASGTIDTAQAGDVEIVNATAKQTGSSWSFSVTLKHGDTGWDHYADLWQVFTPEGTLLGERVLLHPHENEQPFTRSLSGVEIPENVTEILIRARDSVHGMSTQDYTLKLPR